MNRQEYTQTACELICKHRQSVHGNAENSFDLIASYWTTFLNQRSGHKLTPADVGVMMTLFKVARWQMNPNHQDNIIDGIGYLALAGELHDGDEWNANTDDSTY